MNLSSEKLRNLRITHDLPLMELIAKSHQTHLSHHKIGEIQTCKLISIKTGGCTEDCKYCSQSKYYKTSTKPERMMSPKEVVSIARCAVEQGATRVCLASAWRGVKQGQPFNQILEMVRNISAMGIEVCCSLGLMTEEEALLLAEAGLHSYNHNLDSSEEFYKTVVTTRTYQDRLNTLEIVKKANIHRCCGGIIGMGETVDDRLKLILTLSELSPPPDSVPINKLHPIPGTPLEDQTSVNIWDLLRIVATTRLSMPKAKIRMSAGRSSLSFSEQALCFFAGANSIFVGDKLLTTKNNNEQSDKRMFEILGLIATA